MLNACPRCQRTYPLEGTAFCGSDGTRLVPIDSIPAPRDPADPIVGALIAGRYEVRRVIADGGMGRVYEARDTERQQRVALKVLHADIATDNVNIERFRREAETSKALTHPHVVEVFDFSQTPTIPGRPDGGWYLSMEYLDGEELRTVIDRTKIMSVPRVIRVVSQLALALDSAHRGGFVHRDLKPDNVFLVRSEAGDVVKLLDFGSVKFTQGQDRGNKLTVMGTTIGSPFYMSPEQAKGADDLDHRADVWAVAVIVYEALVGKVPFGGGNGPQILFRILGDEPMPPSLASDSAPIEIDDVVVKGLTKDRAKRFQSVGEMADALGRAFKLEGDHSRWGALSEAEIEAEIAEHKAAAPPRPATPPPPQPVAAPSPAAPAVSRPASEYPLPVSSTPTWVYAAVSLAALALALVAFLAFR
ncbi:MAG: serine/threonine-protein kinase [Polyangiales bacterium]